MPVLCSKTLQWNAHWNSCVFSRCLKLVSDGDAVMSGGKLFNTWGAATLKAWSPTVMRWFGGMLSADVDAECSRHRESMFATQRSSRAKYCGAVPCRQWKTRREWKDWTRSAEAPITSGGCGAAVWCARTSMPNIQVVFWHSSATTVASWAECWESSQHRIAVVKACQYQWNERRS